jgi:hypothetical protein
VARVAAGIGCSHAPSIAHAYDHRLMEDPPWKPLFSAFARARQWLLEQNPDALVVIYNDHVDQYFFDAWPTFTIGVAEEYQIADEGWGPRAFPPVPGHAALARHLGARLVEDGFDLAASQRMVLDHGFLSPLPLLDQVGHEWKIPVVPMTINVVQPPLPTPQRCWALGEALARAIQSFPEDQRVAVVGTGGLSHQLTGPTFGLVSPEWDRKFLQLLQETPQELISYSIADFARLGGEHSIEVVQWLAMRAALPSDAKTELQFYYPYGLMGYGIVGLRVP